jgi:hypothetical protein
MFCAGCRCDESHCANCCYTNSSYTDCSYNVCGYAKCRYDLRHYDECHYAECCSAKCGGAVLIRFLNRRLQPSTGSSTCSTSVNLHSRYCGGIFNTDSAATLNAPICGKVDYKNVFKNTLVISS